MRMPHLSMGEAFGDCNVTVTQLIMEDLDYNNQHGGLLRLILLRLRKRIRMVLVEFDIYLPERISFVVVEPPLHAHDRDTC